MTTSQRAEMPYKLIAGVIPVAPGWLLVSARLKGATFAPDFPKIFTDVHDIIHRRPSYAMVAINAPIGGIDDALADQRTCDVDAAQLTTRPTGKLRWGKHPPRLDPDDPLPKKGKRPYLAERYRELGEQMAPYLQRTVCEALPELSFFQLGGERPLSSKPRSDEGYEQRRQLLVKVPGVGRILDFQLDGVDRFQFLEGAAILWSARRISARAGRRVPTESPEWDERGLRIEILR